MKNASIALVVCSLIVCHFLEAKLVFSFLFIQLYRIHALAVCYTFHIRRAMGLSPAVASASFGANLTTYIFICQELGKCFLCLTNSTIRVQ